jgi:hypothetical protein
LRRRLVPFVLIVDDQPGRRIAGDTDLSVLDRAEAVGHHRKAGDAECHGPENVAIVESHLQPFVEILVVHVVNAVHRVHVSTRQPLHCCIELGHHVIVVKEVARDRQRLRRDLIARYLIAATIDRVEQRLCEIDAGAEELHLLAETHCRHAAGDAVVVAPERAHQIVVLILKG